jgi:hypothetical protein
LPRCGHLSPSGRRCSQPVCSSSPHFCFTHDPKLAAPPDTEAALAAELAEAAGDFTKPENVNRVLAKIFHALAAGRLTTKKAGVLSYIAQTILHSQREIAVQKKLEEETRRRDNPYTGPLIDCVPRAIRDDPPEPSRDDARNPYLENARKTGWRSTPDDSPSFAQPSPDLHHFYPWDPTLPPGTQDPHSNLPPETRKPTRSRLFRWHGPRWMRYQR